MVIYNYHSKTIHAESLKLRKGDALLGAYKKIHTLLVSHGLKSKLHFLNNKYAESFKKFMEKNDEKFQLIPLNIHRRNVAERVTQNFKRAFYCWFRKCQ